MMFLKHRARREHGGFSEESPEGYGDLNHISESIIGSSIKIHTTLGPGLLESVYETCLLHELMKKGLKVESQKNIPIMYDGLNLDNAFRADVIVEDKVLVELKSIDKVLPIHEAQLHTYLKLSKIKLGLLINFNVKLLKDGIKRYVF